jgi:hypothetical protein
MVVVMEQSVTSGFTAFIAKFFQATYDTPASKANILAGKFFPFHPSPSVMKKL